MLCGGEGLCCKEGRGYVVWRGGAMLCGEAGLCCVEGRGFVVWRGGAMFCVPPGVWGPVVPLGSRRVQYWLLLVPISGRLTHR